jgi:O-antigen ligase
LYLLGERSFNISTPGIALTQILGRSFMRAYSTFSHPNSFAGYLGLGLLVLFPAYSKKELIRKIWGILIIFIAFILTFSLSAVIGVIVCGVLFLLINKKFFNTKKIIFFPAAFLLISLALPFASNIALKTRPNLPENISQRFDLSSAAGSMISAKFLLGEGLNTFVINEPKINYLGTYLWTLQPVHNIFLLIFSETGIVGLSFFYFLLIKLTKKSLLFSDTAFYLSLVFILTSGLFDHYWFTLQQNMFLAVFVLANSLREER